MGFCRRCGDIVVGPRCKCGGTPVAAAVSFNPNSSEKPQDRWSSTYVSKKQSQSENRPAPAPSTSPTKRFPRPNYTSSTAASNPLGGRVTAHITSSTSQFNRPPSPLKNSTVACPEADILPSLTSNPTGHLAKVYGSVLQSKESLNSHACGICHDVFPPDATIYPEPFPDPSLPPRFLCRNCFTQNGGSKGMCPGCSRAVLALKAEGPFVEAAGTYWHKKCFKCDGCQVNIGDSPMLDLLGRPSCAECFENCLKRDRTPKKNRSSVTSGAHSPNRNLGGVDVSRNPGKSRESSPAIEELEHRLGIQRGSPSLEELSQRLSMIGRNSRSGSPASSRYSIDADSPVRGSPSFRASITSDATSPLGERTRRFSRPDSFGSRRDLSESPVRPASGSSSPAPTREQIDEMKRRFIPSAATESPSSSTLELAETAPKPSPSHPRTRSIRRARSSGSLSNLPSDMFDEEDTSISITSDNHSDISQSTTLSEVDSLPLQKESTLLESLLSRETRSIGGYDDVIVEETSSQLTTPTRTPIKSYVDSATSISKPSPVVSPSPLSPPRGSLTKRPQLAPLSPPAPDISSSSTCAKCNRVLFSVRNGGQYVTVPTEDGDAVRTYHTKCFTCAVCDRPFREGSHGQSLFVKGPKGPCHVECIPPTPPRRSTTPGSVPPINFSSSSSLNSVKSSTSASSTSSNSPSGGGGGGGARYSSRYSRPPMTAPPTAAPTFPRFGSSTACPGCRKAVSPMEFGVVPGPQGLRWHSSCLVCGGKKTGIAARQRKKDEPGCGKKLDSAAKGDADGSVWCRECWLILPTEFRSSSAGSPTRGPLVPTHTGGKVAPQLTGTTTIARQFTGLGGGGGETAQILRQLTGGGRSPTRSLSPTKQLSSANRPRPKSVLGMRSTKSVDEGRGMFLVRQLTGSGNV